MKTVFPRLLIAAIALTLAACSPQFDWREIRSDAAPYVVAMPAKPSTFSRKIDLDGTETVMTMTAAEVGDVTFAVGMAELPDATRAQLSLAAMKTALVNNIRGTVRQEKVLTMAQTQTASGGTLAVTEIEATGPASAATGNQPRVLFARFVARDKRVYQLVATGPEKAVTRDIVATYFSSFKFN
ncbi:MAG TPA: hypothetical protein VN114_01480 [Oxalicibacterium sp.]|uniref:hypothetical protein n=1 Tax=Oxalicibacterium sp. TaxID=2766525 RepID=UPI002C38079E|nr:hypothetical protein [Oxalicibacterium sp.]HWU97154.1 hypothetical protein [Oxalicibacterium sp.]